jgi:predicted NACHT family NTPase
MNQDELRDDLIHQLREGRVVAIVGAGVSMGATNRAPCASWQGLLHHGVKRCEAVASKLPQDWAKRVHAEIDSGDLDDLLSAAEKITQKLGGRGSAEYKRWLEESVGELRAADPAVIQALHQLGVTLATTNYDSLIEEVTGLEPVTWQDQADAVAVVRGEKAGVLHLHGHWKKPESAVLGIRSYEAVLGSDLAQTILRVLQTAKTVLFIGCGEGLSDPNFGALLEWTGDVLGQATHRHYRLCLDGELATLKIQHPPEKRLFPFAYGPDHAALLPFLKTLLTAAGTTAKPASARAPARPALNLSAYAKAVRERYAKLKLDTMDPSGSAYRELELWRVFIPQNVRECQEYLPQVLELPKEHLRRLRESGQWDGSEVDADELAQRRRSYLDQSPRNVLELVDDPGLPHLVVLGEPGSGKSSLLQTLAVQWADTPDAQRADLDLPLLVELRAYALARERGQTADFLQFIEHGHGIPCRLDGAALRAGLEAGRVRVFFDGLDEVFDPALREQVVNAIQLFASDFPRARIIITSRVIGYKGESLRGAEFRHFMLQELDDDQIATFLTKWHADTYRPNETAERDEKHDRLARAIADSPAIRELVSNPLLLAMAAILNRHRILPRQRVELYERCAELLLQQWKVEESLRADETLNQDALAIGLREKQTILRRLAREMQGCSDGTLGNLISATRLETVIEETVRPLVKGNPVAVARALIKHLRERNFILCFAGGDSYAFVHRTFLEYFCADDLRVRFEHEKSIDAEFLKRDLFGRHWADEGWHEVLCLLAGMIDVGVVRKILKFLLKQPDHDLTCRHIFLAARCVGMIRNRPELGQTNEQVMKQIQKLVQFNLPYDYGDLDKDSDRVRSIRIKAVALTGMTWQGSDAAGHWLRTTAQTCENEFVCQAAVAALARGWKDSTGTLPWLKARSQPGEREKVRKAAVAELARGWKDDPQTLPLLKAAAQSDKDWPVRQAAVEALAQGWRDDPQTLPLLKAAARTDKDWPVCQASVECLARWWKDDPATLPLLIATAQASEYWNVRQVAAEAVAEGWKDHLEAATLLKASAKLDKDWRVRREVVVALARWWKDDPQTLPILRATAREDADAEVRQAALAALARAWKDDPQTLSMLREAVIADRDESVRRAAVEEVALWGEGDPETLPLLKAVAQSDANGRVRMAAVASLARGWKDAPETAPWLMARLKSDKNEFVRCAAVEALARWWKDDPKTLPQLKDTAHTDADGSVRAATVASLARWWKGDPEILSWLRTTALSHRHAGVRLAAGGAVARWWKDDPRTLSLLKTIAKEDAARSVRHAAADALERGWYDDAGVQEFLSGLRDRQA